jgi:hypothetical protein
MDKFVLFAQNWDVISAAIGGILGALSTIFVKRKK